ncbi:MAG TPA: hypothetical protein VF721_16265 [Pyrinomonadaceae bacterium]|jgi:hypothetical protein
MNSEEETLPNNEQLLKAIKEMHLEMNTNFNDFRAEMNAKFAHVDERFEDMRLQMMSFDVRLDRMQALVYESLTVLHNTRADVRVLREEVTGWSKEIKDLQLKAA